MSGRLVRVALLIVSSIIATALSARAAGKAAQEDPAPAPTGYVEIEMTGGGAVSGTVKVPEPSSMPSGYKVTRDESTCGQRLPNEAILRAGDGALKNVVVSIEGITRGKAANRTVSARLDNFECRFVPHVLAMSVGQKLVITNSDPILHSLKALVDGIAIFNVALPVQNQKVSRTIREPGLVSIKCDDGHLWMSAFVQAFDHPYFAVTDEKGSFRIDRLPPGRYTLRAWHELLGTATRIVDVAEGEDTSASFNQLTK